MPCVACRSRLLLASTYLKQRLPDELNSIVLEYTDCAFCELAKLWRPGWSMSFREYVDKHYLRRDTFVRYFKPIEC